MACSQSLIKKSDHWKIIMLKVHEQDLQKSAEKGDQGNSIHEVCSPNEKEGNIETHNAGSSAHSKTSMHFLKQIMCRLSELMLAKH